MGASHPWNHISDSGRYMGVSCDEYPDIPYVYYVLPEYGRSCRTSGGRNTRRIRQRKRLTINKNQKIIGDKNV